MFFPSSNISAQKIGWRKFWGGTKNISKNHQKSKLSHSMKLLVGRKNPSMLRKRDRPRPLDPHWLFYFSSPGLFQSIRNGILRSLGIWAPPLTPPPSKKKKGSLTRDNPTRWHSRDDIENPWAKDKNWLNAWWRAVGMLIFGCLQILIWWDFCYSPKDRVSRQKQNKQRFQWNVQ